MITDEKPPLDDDLLMHYGVRGMKWGVSKAKSASGAPGRYLDSRGISKKKVASGVVGTATVSALLLHPSTRPHAIKLAKSTVLFGASAAGKVLRATGQLGVTALHEVSSVSYKVVKTVGGVAGRATASVGKSTAKLIAEASGLTGKPALAASRPKLKLQERVRGSISRGKDVLIRKRSFFSQIPQMVTAPLGLAIT